MRLKAKIWLKFFLNSQVSFIIKIYSLKGRGKACVNNCKCCADVVKIAKVSWILTVNEPLKISVLLFQKLNFEKAFKSFKSRKPKKAPKFCLNVFFYFYFSDKSDSFIILVYIKMTTNNLWSKLILFPNNFSM